MAGQITHKRNAKVKNVSNIQVSVLELKGVLRVQILSVMRDAPNPN